MHEHLEARHEGADLAEVTLLDEVGVDSQASLVVVLLDSRHNLMEAS